MDQRQRERNPRRRIVLWTVAGLAIVVAFGLVLVLSAAIRPAATQGVRLAQDWTARVSKDYPSYTPVGFAFNSFADSSGTYTSYRVGLVPSGRDFVVGVTYLSDGSGAPESTDEVLRQMGAFHDREFALLDYIHANYISAGREVTLGTDPDSEDGIEVVQWTRRQHFGPFSHTTTGSDRLHYDETDMDWSRIAEDSSASDR